MIQRIGDFVRSSAPCRPDREEPRRSRSRRSAARSCLRSCGGSSHKFGRGERHVKPDYCRWPRYITGGDGLRSPRLQPPNTLWPIAGRRRRIRLVHVGQGGTGNSWQVTPARTCGREPHYLYPLAEVA